VSNEQGCGSADRNHRDLPGVIRIRVLRQHVPLVSLKVLAPFDGSEPKTLTKVGVSMLKPPPITFVSARARYVDVGDVGGRDQDPVAHDLVARLAWPYLRDEGVC